MEDNIYEYLKLDHQKVKKLFELFKTAATERNQLEIIALIRKELIVHAESEQATFYKALETHRETQGDIFHAEEEHAEILQKLDDIGQPKKVSTLLQQKISDLKTLVEHHISEEEGKIFKEAKKVLTEAEAVKLKFKMHDLKGKLLTGKKIYEVEAL